MEVLIPLIIPALIIYFLYPYFKRKVSRTMLIFLTIIFILISAAGMIIGLFIGMNLVVTTTGTLYSMNYVDTKQLGKSELSLVDFSEHYLDF